MCTQCKVKTVVPLVLCRLERGPWRLVWDCTACLKMTSVLVHEEVLPMLLAMDFAGGSKLSVREAEEWRWADEDAVSEAVEWELL